VSATTCICEVSEQAQSPEHGVLIASEKEEIAIAFPLLVSFTRHLIRHQVGSDALLLAMYAAADEMKVSKEQMQKLLRAVTHEHATHNIWPRDF
jgi:hypothetical protein